MINHVITYNFSVTPRAQQHDHAEDLLLVVLALVPAIVAATVVFGPRALFMVIYCAVISMFTELVCQRLMQKEVTVTDGSAMLTGVLLALTCR